VAKPGALLEDVEILSGGHVGAHVLVLGSRGRIVLAGERGEGVVHQLVAPAEQHVTEQDRRATPERRVIPTPVCLGREGLEAAVNCRFSAAGVGVIQDVVVDQGGRVEDLKRRAHTQDDVAGGGFVQDHRGIARADTMPAPVGEDRSKTLASAEEFLGVRRERGEVGGNPRQNGFMLDQKLIDAELELVTEVLGFVHASSLAFPGRLE